MIFTRAMIDGWNCAARAWLAQHAVDAVADHDVLLARLDVDIAGALLDRLEHQRVDPADDRRLVVGVEDVDELLGLANSSVSSSFFALLELGAAAQPRRRRLVDELDDRVGGGDHRLDRRVEQHRDVVEDVDRGRIGDRDHAAVVVAAERQHPVLLGEVDRQASSISSGGDVLGAGQLAQARHLGLHRRAPRRAGPRRSASCDQHLAERSPPSSRCFASARSIARRHARRATRISPSSGASTWPTSPPGVQDRRLVAARPAAWLRPRRSSLRRPASAAPAARSAGARRARGSAAASAARRARSSPDPARSSIGALGRARRLLEARAELDVRLGARSTAVDLLDQAALAAVVGLRQVLHLVEGRERAHELAALAHLALDGSLRGRAGP